MLCLICHQSKEVVYACQRCKERCGYDIAHYCETCLDWCRCCGLNICNSCHHDDSMICQDHAKDSEECRLTHGCEDCFPKGCSTCYKCGKETCYSRVVCKGRKGCFESVPVLCKSCKGDVVEKNLCAICELGCCKTHRLKCRGKSVCRKCSKRIVHEFA